MKQPPRWRRSISKRQGSRKSDPCWAVSMLGRRQDTSWLWWKKNSKVRLGVENSKRCPRGLYRRQSTRTEFHPLDKPAARGTGRRGSWGRPPTSAGINTRHWEIPSPCCRFALALGENPVGQLQKIKWSLLPHCSASE